MPHKWILALPAIIGWLLAAPAAAELVVSGVDATLERNIRAFIALDDEPCDAEDWLIRRRSRTLQAETHKALEPFGFYDATVTTHLSFGEDCWQATLTIDPGDPVRYRNVDVRISGAAANDPAFAELPGRDALRPGNVLRHADYDALKRRLQTLAADRGYVDAEFEASRLDVWPQDGAADLTLQFASGPRYNFGEIRIDQSFVNPEIVRGFVDLEPGTPYDAAALTETHRDLSQSLYFGSVAVTPEVDSAANGEIPVRISVQPGTRIEYTVGVGYSTDMGMRFRAGYRNNRINTRGHRFIADANLAQSVQGVSAEYRIPLRDPRSEWFSITGAAYMEDVDTFENDALRLGARWTRIMGADWLRTVSLDFSNESFVVGEDIDTTRLVVPGISFDRKVADRDLFPRRGYRLGVQLRGTDEAIGSSTSYLQLVARARWIRSVGDDNRVLMRLNVGATASKDFNRLPPSVRFFAGGDESIRGYDFDSLGPRDADGNVIGGTNLLIGSIEYEHHVRGNFYGAVFADVGNAFDGFDFKPETGVGVGVKWRSPVGLVRLYLGYPLSADERKIRVHLRLGADL
jgi:translocation and assembly module TamA